MDSNSFLITKVYVKVTAEDGTVSKVYSVSLSLRGLVCDVVDYADYEDEI